jgi:uncharacterized protein YodC (DUF2158 family)
MMATKFKKSETVRVKVVVPQGPVIALRMNEDGEFFYLVEWTDADGVKQQRWFEESELEAV